MTSAELTNKDHRTSVGGPCNESSGNRLRKIRENLGISKRQVEETSRKLAIDFGRSEYYLSHSRLCQIENGQSAPGIYKLAALSAIYGVTMSELLIAYVPTDQMTAMHFGVSIERSRLVAVDSQAQAVIPYGGFGVLPTAETSVLQPSTGASDQLLLCMLDQMGAGKDRFGIIGARDHTLYPLVLPGSLVLINTHETGIHSGPFRNEAERPMYFLQFREGYQCAWCQLDGNRLYVVPHPLSPAKITSYRYREEVEVVGTVTAIARQVAKPRTPTNRPRLPQS